MVCKLRSTVNLCKTESIALNAKFVTCILLLPCQNWKCANSEFQDDTVRGHRFIENWLFKQNYEFFKAKSDQVCKIIKTKKCT